MKNKIKLIVVLSLVTIVAALFSGCFLKDFNRVKSISLVGTPKTTYYVGDSFDAAGLKIQINYVNESQEPKLKELTEKDFNIEFKSDKVGTYKCTITLNDNANISISFDYSVVERTSVFIEGDGSQSSPYVIYTAEQFTHIGEENGAYYKLGKNINFVEENVAAKKFARLNSDGVYALDSNSWNGYASSLYQSEEPREYQLGEKKVTKDAGIVFNSFVLDGNGYDVSFGGNDVSLTGGVETSLFTSAYNATVKNLNVKFLPGSKACTIFNWVYGDLVCENITISGSVDYSAGSYNQGVLAYYDYYAQSITAKNVVNKVNIKMEYNYDGVFVGYAKNVYKYPVKTYNFINCKNEGNISGLAFGMLVGHTGSSNELKNTLLKINAVNFENTGKVVAFAFGAVGYDPTLVGYWGKRDFANDYIVINEENCSGISETSEQVNILGSLVVENGVDKTFVNNNGVVELSEKAKALLEEKNYTLKSYISVSASYKNEKGGYDGSTYFTTKMLENQKYPYVLVEQDKNKVGDGATLTIDFDNNTIIANGKSGDTVYTLSTSEAARKYNLFYIVYDSNGNVVNAYKVLYKNIQNA